MASIDINLNNIGKVSGSGASSDFLQGVLNKLDAAIEKLNQNIEKNNKVGEQERSKIDAAKQQENSWGRVGNQFGRNFATALAAGIGSSVMRIFDNQANAIMNRAANAGNFIAASIGGRANQAFGGYASNYVMTEAQRIMANNTAIASGAGMAAGGVLGTIGGGVFGALVGDVPGAVEGMKKGGLAGGAAGYGVGNYEAASRYNQFVIQKALAQAAKVQQLADATTSQWKTGFSRFGLKMSNQTIVGSEFTHGAPVTGMIAKEFYNRYGADQNFGAIQNQITPYLPSNTNLLSKQNDLGKVAQNFLQAGFAVSQFSNLTMQASQYQAMTGNNIQKFSEDIRSARSKFGDAYDVSTNQTALNLMQLGISQNQAQHLANQSMYNPGLLNNVNSYMNASFSDYYKREAVGDVLGIDTNASLRTGHIVEKRKGAAAQLRKDLRNYARGKAPTDRMALYQTLMSNAGMASLLQNEVAEGKSITGDAGLSSAQQSAYQSGTVQGLMQNVENMNVNAGTVNIFSGENIGGKIANVFNNNGKKALPTHPMHGSWATSSASPARMAK